MNLCFIIMFNRLTWPKMMAEYLSDTGCQVILIDNCSTYPPLLEWYQKCPYKVYRFHENHGHLVLWNSGLINEFDEQYYAVTDPDLDLSEVPKDYWDVLMKSLLKNSDITKCGLSLRIDDLPDNKFTEKIIENEIPYWNGPKTEDGFTLAGVDTTFAVYDRNRMKGECQFYKCLRSPFPYTARHLPWYLTSQSIDFEELYYMQNATNVSTFIDLFKENL